jgi:hypothetical protein
VKLLEWWVVAVRGSMFWALAKIRGNAVLGNALHGLRGCGEYPLERQIRESWVVRYAPASEARRRGATVNGARNLGYLRHWTCYQETNVKTQCTEKAYRVLQRNLELWNSETVEIARSYELPIDTPSAVTQMLGSILQWHLKIFFILHVETGCHSLKLVAFLGVAIFTRKNH